MGQEILCAGELLPDLGQKGGAGHAFTDDCSVKTGAQFCKQVFTIGVFQVLGIGQYADLDFCLFKFRPGKWRETGIVKGSINGITRMPSRIVSEGVRQPMQPRS